MPLRLTPEQITGLQDRGVIAPPSSEAPTAIESETALRVLGNIGLPGSEVVERISELPDTDPNNLEMSPEALNWARIELDNTIRDNKYSPGALGSWKFYQKELGVDVPMNLDELAQTNPNLMAKLTRLYETKMILTASGEVTPDNDNTNIGDTMHLLVMPWQAIWDHQHMFGGWLKTMRDCQGITTPDDVVIEQLITAISSNQPLYRAVSQSSQLLTVEEYLESKIAEDGPWGVMLAQASNLAGFRSIVGQSPDEMTVGGTRHLQLVGQHVDAMGIFEWLALTLQEDPRTLSSGDHSWLLANRLSLLSGLYVPDGCWTAGGVSSGLSQPDYVGSDTRVRLAVSGSQNA